MHTSAPRTAASPCATSGATRKEELEKLERGRATSRKDDLDRAEKELQKLTDQFVAEIDEIQRHKEQELMEV